MKLRKIALCLLVLSMAVPLYAQGDRGTAEATIKGKKITITYGRPSLKGRDIFSLASIGTIWRLGMNQATEITTTGTLVFGGKRLAPGKYSLWAKKTGEDSWALLFHPKTGIWGAPELKEGFVAETPLKLEKVNDSEETLTITLADTKGKAGIRIHWGNGVLVGWFDIQ
ncbi:MAG: hypothetical protein DMF61_15195 [Blastocatellia bacterium AA13]|nr:MAG: hypothetical protein DMF61_15195 [Blastocatellia bacterium AA13]